MIKKSPSGMIKETPEAKLAPERGAIGGEIPKEPWMMTKAEFVKAVREGQDFPQLGVKPTPLSTLRSAKDYTALDKQAIGYHAGQTTIAVASGKPVPAEVLKDYPDLQAKPAPVAPEVTKLSGDQLRHEITRVEEQVLYGQRRLQTKTNAIGEKLSQPEIDAVQRQLVADQKTLTGLKAQLAIPKAVTPPITEAGKQPWQMTWQEWYDYYHSIGGGNRFSFASQVGKSLGIKSQAGEPLYQMAMPEGMRRVGESGSSDIERWRKAIIRQALSEGKPIPPEVLRDYPDLAKPPAVEEVAPTLLTTPPETTLPMPDEVTVFD